MAIDASALGGMYAGRIFLIATEKGVGVNLEGTVQSADQMVITADGKLRLREAASGGDVVLAAKGDIAVTGGGVTAARDVSVSAENVRVSKGVFTSQYGTRKATGAGAVTAPAAQAGTPEPPKSSLLYAGRDMSLTTASELSNTQSEIRAGGDLRISGAKGVRNDGGTVAAGRDLAISAPRVSNDGGSLEAGEKLSVIRAASLRNVSGLLSAGKDMTLRARILENVSGRFTADGDLALRGDSLNNDQGEIGAQGALSFLTLDGGAAASLRNASGSLTAGETLRLDARVLDNLSGLLGAGGDMALLRLGSLNNTGGGLIMGREMLIHADALRNEQSEIRASGNLELAGAQGGRAVSLRNASGTISADLDLSLNVERLANERTVLDIARDTRSQAAGYWVDNQRWGDGDEAWWDVHRLTWAWDSLVKATPAAAILASGDIRIAAGTLYNAYSHIAAGKDLSVLAVTSLINQSAAVYKSAYENVEYCHDDEDGDFDHYGPGFKTFTSREVLTPFAASLTAGRTLTLQGAALQNLTDRDYASPLTDKDLKDLTQAAAPEVPGVTSPNLPSLPPFAPDDPTAPSLSRVAEVLAQSPMFRPVASPGHHYLIETNPLLTKLGNFYGSDYFWERIGLDRERQEAIALGDAFFETRLVQQQVLDATGRRFLSGYSSDGDQMRGLMDNAVAQAGDLKLAAGVALTSQQVAALTDDIVWLVEQEVNGQKVMVPQVYLAANSKKARLRGGSLIAANDVQIRAGSVTNSGSVIRGNTLSMLANNITNTGGGLLSGETLQLAAVQDIRNTGSTIAGQNLSLAAGRDLVSEARIVGGGNVTRLGQTGGIAASDSLRIGAGRDLTVAGSTVTAGGDAALGAGRNVNVTTVTSGSSFHGYHLDEDKVTHHGSSVAVGGKLQISAGNDLTVAGSGVAAGGDATLAAGRNLTVTAVQDVFRQEIRGSSSRGLLGSSSSRRTEERVTSKAASVAAGGNLSLLAGVSVPGAPGSGQKGHASVVGSNLLGGKDLNVAASGNVNVASSQNSYSFSYSQSSTGALGLSSSSKQQGNASVSQAGSNLVGQNVTLDAGKSVSVTASALAAAGNLSLTARDDDVAVVDGANRSTSWYSKKQTGFGLGGAGSFTSFYGTEGKKEASASGRSQGSLLAAGQDISLTASRDAAIVGSNLSAGRDVSITAGRDANILGGANTSSYSKETFAAGFGVEGILGLDKSSAFVGYQQLATGQDKAATRNAASRITADNNLTVKAGQNVNISGSKLATAQDLNMAAGKDINLLQATNTDAASAYEQKLRAGLSLELSQNLTGTAKKAYTAGNEAVGKLNEKDIIGAGERAYDAYNSAQALANPNASASLMLGVNSSWSNSQSHSATAVPDELSAGRDMALAAGRDLNMQGAQAQAGKNMTIAAGRDVNVHAAHSSQSSSSSKGGIDAGLGVSASLSKSGYALGVKGSLALNGQEGDGSAHTHDNAKLVAGEKLTTDSGRDTTVAGGNLTAKDVDMTVGRNLTVASVQDTGSSHNNSYNAGASATVGYGADISVTQGANLGFGFQQDSGNAVKEQTSILGSDRVNIYTENNTHVAGAIIAALNDNLKLDTGTLSHENLVGKTTQTGMSAGIKWGQTFKPGGNNEPEGGSEGGTKQPVQNNQEKINSRKSALYDDAKPWMIKLGSALIKTPPAKS